MKLGIIGSGLVPWLGRKLPDSYNRGKTGEHADGDLDNWAPFNSKFRSLGWVFWCGRDDFRWITGEFEKKFWRGPGSLVVGLAF